MTSTEITHHFTLEELRSGFKRTNLRVIVTKFADGTPGILLGGSYLEFNRINDTLGVTFRLQDIKYIARELLALTEAMEHTALLNKIDSFMQLFEDDS